MFNEHSWLKKNILLRIMSVTWLNNTSLIMSTPSITICIHPWTKIFYCRICEIQPHTPRAQGRVLPTHVSVPAVDTAMICKLSIASSGHGLGAHEENCLIQSPSDERICVEIQASSREIPAHFWGKKKKFGCIGENNRNNLTLYMLLILEGNTDQSLLNPWFLSAGKVRTCEWVPGFASYVGHCKRGPFFSHSIQYTEPWAPWLGGRKKLGDR